MLQLAFHSVIEFISRNLVDTLVLHVVALTWTLSYLLSKVSKTLGRKCLHMGMGVCTLYAESVLDASSLRTLLPVAGVLMSFVTLFQIFNFVRPKDINILTYIATVVTTMFLGIELKYISAMFFADPLACIVGKLMTKIGFNIKLINSKSLAGSLTAWIIAYACLEPMYGSIAILYGAIVSLTELVVLNNDNFYIWSVLMSFYYLQCAGY
ncbi:hypothetical protein YASMINEVIRUS_586 [Yasminevirus sp. GU-2018]|uniref:Uncharacterized protein n=1 Tax=Yasminevirus sp. GU-2018 TaxID=2420051 RepID=A0A5K0U9N6_9VIRU|nr:hypothetical protein YASMINEVIRUS_586 [Yasminevirus sp. GU-2018]